MAGLDASGAASAGGTDCGTGVAAVEGAELKRVKIAVGLLALSYRAIRASAAASVLPKASKTSGWIRQFPYIRSDLLMQLCP